MRIWHLPFNRHVSGPVRQLHPWSSSAGGFNTFDRNSVHNFFLKKTLRLTVNIWDFNLNENHNRNKKDKQINRVLLWHAVPFSYLPTAKKRFVLNNHNITPDRILCILSMKRMKTKHTYKKKKQDQMSN